MVAADLGMIHSWSEGDYRTHAGSSESDRAARSQGQVPVNELG